MMNPSTPDPSIGRIVHYVLPEGSPHRGQHRPAIVTQVWHGLGHASSPGMSDLTVLVGQVDDFGTYSAPPVGGVISRNGPVALVGSVLYSEEPGPGTWHWPEPVPMRRDGERPAGGR